MRAIIIDDKDARALLDSLKLESMETGNIGYGVEENEAWHSLPENVRREIIKRVHGRFHYIVCGWLQDQGARTT